MMTRLSSGLIVAALVMLVVSFVPWPSFAPAAVTQAAVTHVAEEQGSGGAEEIESSATSVSVDATAEATPMAIAPAEHGRTLFMIKGCASCHTYVPITGDGLSFGPNLTHYDPDPAFLHTWLRDPATVRPGTEMPDLELNDDEIEALIAFLLLEE
jgi:cytochrome c2